MQLHVDLVCLMLNSYAGSCERSLYAMRVQTAFLHACGNGPLVPEMCVRGHMQCCGIPFEAVRVGVRLKTRPCILCRNATSRSVRRVSP